MFQSKVLFEHVTFIELAFVNVVRTDAVVGAPDADKAWVNLLWHVRQS